MQAGFLILGWGFLFVGGDFARAGGLCGLLLRRFVCLGVWLGVVDFGRLSRFLLMGSYRFWIVGVGW